MGITTDVGNNYEAVAAEFLKKLGYKIIEKNYRVKAGEIDIIASDKKTVVFVEVKFRKNSNYGNPYEFVTIQKQQKIIKAALLYIKQNKLKTDFRFDVVSICDNKIEHIKNAFSALPKYFF
ncbi:YraN family protein [Candidatus Ruminimicrobium bovinum]|uniref:YraN family protein n=1 Tax=Candidatus Ruminimicrobium bovinum TaxID=3242779 RepID=UPI0039B8E2BB